MTRAKVRRRQGGDDRSGAPGGRLGAAIGGLLAAIARVGAPLGAAFDPAPMIGPGRAGVRSLWRGIGRSRYDGARLRALRAERGVGRPPKRSKPGGP